MFSTEVEFEFLTLDKTQKVGMLQNNYLRIKQMLRAYPKLALLSGKKVKLISIIRKLSCMIKIMIVSQV